MIMNNAPDVQATELLMKGYQRKRLTKDEIVFLLDFPEDSEEACFAIALADRFIRERCDNTGDIGIQIGTILGPCIGDCDFCNFAKSTTKLEPYVMPDDVLKDYVTKSIRFHDVTSVSLMTIHNFDIDDLVHQVKIVKNIVPKGVGVTVNTGDLSLEDCSALKEAGVIGAYHVLRLGEGICNKLDPKTRLQTMRNLTQSGILVTTCTEPIGPEHTSKEIADNYFVGMSNGCISGAVMKRVPVPGTVLSDKGEISERRMEQIAAVMALSSSWYQGPFSFFRWDFGYHGGFNKMFAEYGGSPRDTDELSENNRGHTVEWARRELFLKGYDKIMMDDGSTSRLDLDYLRATESL